MKNIELAKEKLPELSDAEIIEKFCPSDIGGIDYHPSHAVSYLLLKSRNVSGMEKVCTKCWENEAEL